jgi:N-acetylglucosamine-6-phosphate deacetylase
MSHRLEREAGYNQESREIVGLSYIDEKPVSIGIKNGKIYQIKREITSTDGSRDPIYIGPGLIDIQVNGYVGNNFTGEMLTVQKIKNVVQDLVKVGVTSFLPTLITTSRERLLENFSVLNESLNDPFINQSIPGFHLEGPYINPVDGYRGAHNKEWVKSPDWGEFEEIDKIAGGKILLISLAPELKGALNFIQKAHQAGKVVALAHHNASAEVVRKAADAGASLCTHLGNGIADLLHRRDNPFWSQLAEDRLRISIIVDSFHLSPEEVKVFYRVKGSENIILVSDMTDLAGLPPGKYFWDNKNVVLSPEGVIRFPEQNVLAGAALPLVYDLGNMISFTNCSLKEGFDMASLNPAKLLDLNYGGELVVGKRADLICFSLKDNKIDIHETIINGKTVYQKNHLKQE